MTNTAAPTSAQPRGGSSVRFSSRSTRESINSPRAGQEAHPGSQLAALAHIGGSRPGPLCVGDEGTRVLQEFLSRLTFLLAGDQHQVSFL
jgi:hypothetical protein